ncbi:MULTISPECIES: bacillithiol biosynthesis cysteine-adding enzyme BshC [Bacillus]|uniref:Putative cysteine ligase BshC n=2 Tax=Bacillus TaxID=1386 RepID=A0A0M4FPQ5_9BACI|nr:MULTISPECIES: bacillithiol biosynthesis cysteine-adding enzyme BshC [Bacillus]ALC80959.1 hypothetical protein AM592_04665 [Bacillus gobiensis]MBP1079908.1 bacillithiol biosynthesis cysteine-adding enzyme BshC [Bacillus capparidis]MED1095295.1 bacillithiol biosynthesis cysteine-adding enzyme BshC [Bacillus capparidis]
MQLTALSIQSKNPFVRDYIEGKKDVLNFFDYDMTNDRVWEDRLNDLSFRTFSRDTLADYLLEYHKKFKSDEMNLSIEKIRNPNSVMIVGGQQAGLLTGPLYTIHKVISIIVLAKEKEEQLQVPVIPLFWVAGEDHDIEEINHVFTAENGRLSKKKLSQNQVKKSCASRTLLDKRKCKDWIDEVFKTYGETEYTLSLMEELYRCLDCSDTYVEFFEQIIANLFQEDGLLLLNSGDPGLRKLETEFFQELLEKNDDLADALEAQQEDIAKAGYSNVIDYQEKHANLFYEFDGERFLIRKSNGNYTIHDLGIEWSEDELIQVIKETPEAFSNNVVTRPLMQEFLLPTLAFIAGPGELSYWAELKRIFHIMDFKMAPLVPRLNISILERHIDTKLLERNLELSDVIENGVERWKNRYFTDRIPEDFEASLLQAKTEIESIHSRLRYEALQIDNSLEGVVKKNAAFIQQQLDFLDHSVKKSVKRREDRVLRDFDRIQTSLCPDSSLQERIWNIMYYLNKYGPDFIKRFKSLPFSFQNKHNVVKL